MDIEKIVVSLIGDTTKFDRAMDSVSKKTEEVLARIEKAAGKDVFAGMTESARKAAASMAVEMSRMEQRQTATMKSMLRAQYEAMREFQKLQDARFAKADKKYQERKDFVNSTFDAEKATIPVADKKARRDLETRRKAELAKLLAQFEKEAGAITEAKGKFEGKHASAINALLRKYELERSLLEHKFVGRMFAHGAGGGPEGPGGGKVGPSFLQRNKPAQGSDFMSGLGLMAVVTAANLAANAVAHLGHAVMEAGRYAITAGAHYEVLDMQLRVLSGSAEKGNQLFSDLLKTAVETPFRVKDVVSAAKELKAFGFATDEVNGTVKALGDISAATGTPMHRLILAFGQTRIAGRLMGQEMRQFVNANVPLVENLSAVMGKPAAQIKKMIENGQVGFSDVAKALNRLVGAGGQFEGMMDQMSNTVQGRWNSVVDLVEIGVARIGQAFMKGAGVNEFLNRLKEGMKGLDPDFAGVEQAGKVFREWVNAVFDAGVVVAGFVREHKELIAQILKTVAVLTALNVAYRITLGLLKALVVWTGIYKAALVALSVVSAVVSGLTAAWGLLVAAVSAPFVAIGIIAGVIASVVLLITYFDDVKYRAENAADGIKNAFNGLVSFIRDLVETFTLAFRGIVDAVKAGDMQLAGDIAFKALEIAFKSVIAAMKEEWSRFLRFLSDPASGPAMASATNRTQMLAERAANRLDFTKTQEERDEKEFEITRRYEQKEKQLRKMAKEEEARRKMEVDEMLAPLIEEYQRPVVEAKKQLEALVLKAGVARTNSEMTSEMKSVIALMDEQKAYRSDYFSTQGSRLRELSRVSDAFADLDSFDPDKDVSLASKISEESAKVLREYIRPEQVNNSSAKAAKSSMLGVLDFAKRGLTAEITKHEEGFKGRQEETTRQVTKNLSPMIQAMTNIAMNIQSGGRTAAIGSIPNEFRVPFDISGAAKTVGMNVQQRFMRGVGEETHKFDFFKNQLELIEEARSGLPKDLRMMTKSPGMMGAIMKGVGEKNRVLGDAEADFGMLDEFDKLQKWVGDRRADGPRPMVEGSSEARETINRAQVTQVSILEHIRTVLITGQAMQAQQLEYQKQATAALRSLVPTGGTAVAPPPREVGFVGGP